MEGFKIMNQKSVGKYKVVLMHHVNDSKIGAVNLLTMVDRELKSLHHTGPVLKENAAKLYSNMNRNEKIEEFLENTKKSAQGVMGFGKSVRY